MTVVDARVLIAVFLVQDVHHQAIRVWFDQQGIAGAELAALILLLMEAAGAISWRTGD